MRFATTALAVCLVASILVAQACVYVGGEEAREKRAEIREKYDLSGYYEELEENGLDPQQHSRLYPGSIDQAYEAPASEQPESHFRIW